MADSRSTRGLREIVYGSSSSSSSDEAPAASGPTSAVVRTMASSIYEELERMIKNYGDGVVTALVPQLITVLEYWEKTVNEKHGVQLELDLQRADLSQLLKQFEKERQLRRAADQVTLAALLRAARACRCLASLCDVGISSLCPSLPPLSSSVLTHR